MAMPPVVEELNAKRLALVQQIADLKTQAAQVKKEMDREIEIANMKHKLGLPQSATQDEFLIALGRKPADV